MRIQLRARRGQGWLCSSITPAGLALLQDQGNLLLMLQFQARAGKAEGKKGFACSKCTKPRREQEPDKQWGGTKGKPKWFLQLMVPVCPSLIL